MGAKVLRCSQTAVLLFCLVPFAKAQVQVPTVSNRQVHRLEQTAHTEADFRLLSSHYAHSEEHYKALAQQQEQAYRDAVEQPIPGGKFPTAIDIAFRWKEYFQRKAEEADRKRSFFASKLSPGSSVAVITERR